MQLSSSLIASRPQEGGPSAGQPVVAFLGSYPPRPCTIATFTEEICTHYPQVFPGSECLALAMTDDDQSYDYPATVCFEIQESREEDYRQAARFLNGVKPSVVSLQHDYEIFGGCDGKLLIDFLNACEIPLVTTMHSVIANPTPRQWQVTENIISGSCSIVVMTEKARDLLLEHYTVNEEDIHVIPHGVRKTGLSATEVVSQYERVFTLARKRERTQPAVAPCKFEERHSARDDSFLQWFDHLLLMTDDTGIWHRAHYQMPDPGHGYCLSDNAAALLLTGHLRAAGNDAELPWNEFSNPYFSFVLRAFNAKNGRFRNFLSAEERWLEEAGSEDSQAQALWALGSLSELNTFTYLRAPIRSIFKTTYPVAGTFFNLRSRAYALLGLSGHLTAEPNDVQARALHRKLKNRMAQQFTQNGGAGWPWPEDTLVSSSAKLPHALLTAAHACDDEFSVGLALNSLEWLMELQTAPSGSFRPLGNQRRYSRTSRRGPAQFDQLPGDVHASISACIAAWRITGQDSWFHLAENTFQWFLGANDLGLSLYDPNNGGCCDALQEHTVNENQSAQSLLAYHLSLVELKTARREFFASQGSVASPLRQAPQLVAASV